MHTTYYDIVKVKGYLEELGADGRIILKWMLNKYKKLWEKLVACFSLIQHGPHRKRNNYVDTHRQQGDLIIYTVSYGDFYRAVA
jgi:hypothetical protein